MAKEKTPTPTKAPVPTEGNAPKKTPAKQAGKTAGADLTKAAPKAAAKPVAQSPVPAQPEEKAKKEVKDVHTLSFVAGKGWAVKRQGSDKVIKYFKTKFEATEYIVQVSGNQKTSVVIRLKNGKFQKFDNAMKALSYAKSAKEDE